MAELARFTLSKDFRRIDPGSAKVLLVEAGSRVLGAFPESLQAYATKALAQAGVQLRLNCTVTGVGDQGVETSDGLIPAATIVWAAGIRAAAAAEWLPVTPDRLGRIPVESNMQVASLEHIYAIGDLARFEQDGGPLPALAQVARQQGLHLGAALRAAETPGPFRYTSRGDTAVIGRHAAIFSLGRVQLRGRLAWLLWALVHVYLLIGADKRVLVATEWVWRYFTFERGARLID